MVESSEPVRAPKIIRISGDDPYERGTAYGSGAADQITIAIGAYERAVRHYADLSWPQAVAVAERFVPTIQDHAPALLAELRGIADGASVPLGDILVLNCRSELLYGYPSVDQLPEECTSLAILPERSADGHTYLAQNWDWLVDCADTVVALVVERTDGPSYFTVVEAGMLAKTGMNAAGIGLCTNTLIAERNLDFAGLPYHVLLRRCLDATRVSDAVRMLVAGPRAVAGNYLLASGDGAVVNVETLPGGVRTAACLLAEDGILTHANHVLSPKLANEDVMPGRAGSTIVRQDRIRRRLTEAVQLDSESVRSSLTDHVNGPLSVCLHAHDAVPEPERSATLASVVYDLTTTEFHLAVGNPCINPYLSSNELQIKLS